MRTYLLSPSASYTSATVILSLFVNFTRQAVPRAAHRMGSAISPHFLGDPAAVMSFSPSNLFRAPLLPSPAASGSFFPHCCPVIILPGRVQVCRAPVACKVSFFLRGEEKTSGGRAAFGEPFLARAVREGVCARKAGEREICLPCCGWAGRVEHDGRASWSSVERRLYCAQCAHRKNRALRPRCPPPQFALSCGRLHAWAGSFQSCSHAGRCGALAS